MHFNNMDVTDIALCDACYVIDKSAFAGTFCVDCKQKLCTECQLDHNKFPAMRGHKRVPLTDMTAGMNASYKQSEPISFPLNKCDYHHLKEVGFFCYDHKEVYCSLCRAVKHANCNERPITDVCGMLETDDLEHALATLDELAEGLGRAMQERQTQAAEMVMMKNVCIEEIRNLKQRMARLFDLLEKNVDQKVAEANRCVEGFAEKATLYDDAMHHVMSLSDQVRQALGCGDQGTIFAAQTKAQKLKTDYTQLVENYRADMTPVKLVFAQDDHIIDLLSTCESLGEVKLQSIEPVEHSHQESAQMIPADMLELFLSKKSEHVPKITARIAPARSQKLQNMPSLQQPRPLTPMSPNSPTPPEILPLQQPRPLASLSLPKLPPPAEPKTQRRVPTFSQITGAPTQKVERKNSSSSTGSTNTTSTANTTEETRNSFTNVKLKDRQNHCIKHKGEYGDHDITGLAFAPSGDLVMCDHFHKKIKVLNENFKVTHSKRLADHPWDVTVIDSSNYSEIAVTLTKKKTVQFLSVDDNDGLYYNGSFQTKKMCWGIEAFHDSMIITFHDNPGNGSVEIRTRKGEVLKQICNTDEDNPLFLTPIYVALDGKKERFFVTDGKNNSVISCSVNGDAHHSVAKNKQLWWPKGIVVDDESNLIVSAHYVDQLKLLKNKGKSAGGTISGLVAPQALTCRWEDSCHMILVVSSNKGNEISVLTFENK